MQKPLRALLMIHLCFSTVALAIEVPNLGRLDFPNSGAAEAQEAFARGVLQLHNFEFDDSHEAFVEARTIDPDFALAYWGEAMTFNHPLWRQQDREAGLAALARYAPTAEERFAKAPSERERGYLEAIEILYGPGDDKVARDVAYAEAMRQLSETYPEDMEARAFYALSVLGTTQGERDFRVYMRAGAIAEEVFAANDRHPGAVHYMIHSYDDPVHAPLGVRAARVYAKIAPAASHAQHMISHIFVALGEWEESVQSNINAYEVSKARREAKGLSVDALNYHALHWLQYSYLQLGLIDDARDILDLITAYATESQTKRAVGYYGLMRGMWAAETGGEFMPEPMSYSILDGAGSVQDYFGSGYAAIQDGRLVEAKGFLEALRRTMKSQTGSAEEMPGMSMAMSGGDTSHKKSRVMELSLAGSIASFEGHKEVARTFLEEATKIEAELPLEYGPPDINKPSHEIYGEVLLASDEPEAAAEMFRAALSRAPQRTASLFGLAEAAQRVDSRDTLASTCAKLKRIVSRGASAERAKDLCSG
jgi:tetratricopeptide (TPR) repeat protein